MFSWIVSDLLRCLKRAQPREFKIVVMPDFFIDRFVTYRGGAKQFYEAIVKVAERRGGNIHGVRQTELRGGNAANTAAALAKLDVKVYPIITTDSMGFQLLHYYLGSHGVDLFHVKLDGEVGLTTAIELRYNDERVNIMMGHLGSLPDFGPRNLTEKDFELLQKADYVCVFDWASTRRWGTELAEHVFRHVKEEGKAKTYFDSGDPTPNSKNIPKLMRKVLQTGLVDVLSVNENEAFQYSSRLDPKVKGLRHRLDHWDFSKECARVLAKHLPARVDLHTAAYSGSFTWESEVVVPTFPVEALRSTGAGDAWNAGNIYGDSLKIPDSCRLTLANAVAAYYVCDVAAEHPTLPKLIEFCQKQQQT